MSDPTSADAVKYDSHRRAVYLPVIRNNLYKFFEQFDFPDPTMPSGDRHTTVVAPQALLLMNDDLVMDSAAAMAKSICDRFSQPEQRVEFAYQLAYSRSASAAETARAVDFVTQLENTSYLDDAADLQKTSTAGNRQQTKADDGLFGWSLFCQSLMAANEFIYIP